MTQTVTLPDGSIHNFPDEATPEMMSAVLGLKSSAAKPEAAERGYGANLKRADTVYAQNIENALTEPFAMDKTAGPEWLQRVGDVGGRIGTVASSAVGMGAAPYIEAPVKTGLAEVANTLANKYGERAPGSAQKWVDNTGDVTTAAASMAVPFAAEKMQGVIGSPFVKNMAEDLHAPTPPKTPAPTGPSPPLWEAGYEPSRGPVGIDKLNMLPEAAKGTTFARQPNTVIAGLKGNQAISAAYDADQNVMNGIANNLRGEGNKFTLQMPEIYDKLEKTIGTISKRVALGTKEDAALRDLIDIRDNLVAKYAAPPKYNPGSLGMESTPTAPSGISPNDLVDIRKSINAGLNTNKFLTSGGGKLLDLKNTVNEGLGKAAEVSPIFGEHLGQFDKQAAKIGLYHEDSIKPLWQPEDHVAWKAKQNNPDLPGVAHDTVSRANTFLKELNNVKAGRASALADILPPDQAVPILRDAIINAKRTEPSMFNATGQLVTGHPLAAGKTALTSIISPKPSPLVQLAKQIKKPTLVSRAMSIAKPFGVGASALSGFDYLNTDKNKSGYSKGGLVKPSLTSQFLARKKSV